MFFSIFFGQLSILLVRCVSHFDCTQFYAVSVVHFRNEFSRFFRGFSHKFSKWIPKVHRFSEPVFGCAKSCGTTLSGRRKVGTSATFLLEVLEFAFRVCWVNHGHVEIPLRIWWTMSFNKNPWNFSSTWWFLSSKMWWFPLFLFLFPWFHVSYINFKMVSMVSFVFFTWFPWFHVSLSLIGM